MSRGRSAAVVTLVVAVLASVANAQPNPRLFASDDSYVLSGSPATSFGDGLELRTGGNAAAGTRQRAFVRFQLPRGPWTGAVVSATLRARFVSGTSLPHDLHFVSDDDWTEGSLTWETQPDVSGAPVGSADAAELVPNRELSWDVTALARQEQAGDGALSFRLAVRDEASIGIESPSRWASREGPGSGFHLEVVFEVPQTLAPDDLFLAGTEGRRILRFFAFDPETRLAKPLAAFGTVNGLGALAVDPRDGTVVAVGTDTGFEDSLVRIDPATGAVEEISIDPTWGGQLSDGIEVAPDGQIYVLAYGGRLLRVDPEDGSEHVVAQGGSLVDLHAIALEPDGGLLVLDWQNGLLRIDPATGGQTQLVPASEFGRPRAMTLDATGALWVIDADWDDHLFVASLMRIDLVTGSITRPPVSLGSLAGCIASEASGALLLGSCFVGNAGSPAMIERFHPDTGTTELVLDFQGESTLGGFAADPGGGVLATQHRGGSPRLLRIDEQGVQVVAAPLYSSFAGTRTLAVADERGRLLVATGDRVTRLDLLRGVQEPVSLFTFDSPEDPRSVRGIALSPAARLVALTHDGAASSSLVEIDRTTGAQQVVFSGLQPFAKGIAAEPTGTWLVGNHRSFGSPVQHEGSILRVDLGAGTSAVVSAGGLLSDVHALAVDRAGAILAVDARAGRVVRVDPVTGGQELVGPTQTGSSARLTVDRAGRPLAHRSVIQRFEADGRIVIVAGPGDPGAFVAPVVAFPACDDGFDNDGDGAADWPADPECRSPDAPRERPCGVGWELAPLLGLLAWRRRRLLFRGRPP